MCERELPILQFSLKISSHMFCFVVEKNSQEDDSCSKAGKERDRVAKYDDGEPYQ